MELVDWKQEFDPCVPMAENEYRENRTGQRRIHKSKVEFKSEINTIVINQCLNLIPSPQGSYFPPSLL